MYFDGDFGALALPRFWQSFKEAVLSAACKNQWPTRVRFWWAEFIQPLWTLGPRVAKTRVDCDDLLISTETLVTNGCVRRSVFVPLGKQIVNQVGAG